MADALHAIEARCLAVRRGARTVVRDLDFEAGYGEILVILGPNGAGKSTLLRALCGLLPCAGEIRIAGHPLSELAARDRALLLSFVPQTPSLGAPLPVREVVAQGRYAHTAGIQALGPRDRSVVVDAMRRTDVLDLANRPYTDLSRGEQQRVMLARALATEARILCLDEPTAALDVAHALQFFELLQRLRREGYALLIVLHQLADALRFGDRALLMSSEHGQLLGPVAEVIDQGPVAQVYGVRLRANAGLEFDRVLNREDQRS